MNEQDKLMMKVMEELSYIKGILTSDLNTVKEDVKIMKNSMNDVYQLKHEVNNLKAEIQQMKDQRLWIVRIASGAVITMAITAFVWLLTGQKF